MAIPESWSGEAFNPVPESENRIHGDEIARAYGFRGGLVPPRRAPRPSRRPGTTFGSPLSDS